MHDTIYKFKISFKLILNLLYDIHDIPLNLLIREGRKYITLKIIYYSMTLRKRH